MKKIRTSVLLALTVLAAPAAEAQEGPGFRGWGLRAGVSDRPDQLLVGVQADFGELIENLRFEPNIELGVGDDQTILSLGAPVWTTAYSPPGWPGRSGRAKPASSSP